MTQLGPSGLCRTLRLLSLPDSLYRPPLPRPLCSLDPFSLFAGACATHKLDHSLNLPTRETRASRWLQHDSRGCLFVLGWYSTTNRGDNCDQHAKQLCQHTSGLTTVKWFVAIPAEDGVQGGSAGLGDGSSTHKGQQGREHKPAVTASLSPFL